MTRRTAIGTLAGAAASRLASAAPSGRISLFDGKTLDGWIQVENSAFSVPSGSISDPAAFVAKIAGGTDPVSTFLRSRLSDQARADLAAWSASNANANAVLSASLKELNRVLAEGPIFDRARFKDVVVRTETAELLRRDPQNGERLARLNKMLIEDAYPHELIRSATTGWVVKDGAMASTGSGRGVIYTANDYGRFRLTFTMRHVSGNPDHQACVLIFCQRPRNGELPLDALAGIQFQVPNGGHWDYRPSMNNNGGDEFTPVSKTKFDVHEWSRVEILADAGKGAARMAVAQPVGSKAVEVLDFHDPAAGRPGPVALQMHNAGLFDEYKDIEIETDPSSDELVTTK